eukprot:2359369-Alexandrium_andersonii.AAC.1
MTSPRGLSCRRANSSAAAGRSQGSSTAWAVASRDKECDLMCKVGACIVRLVRPRGVVRGGAQ